MMEKNNAAQDRAARSKQEHSISFLGIDATFTDGEIIEQLVLVLGGLGGLFLTIFSLGLYAGVI